MSDTARETDRALYMPNLTGLGSGLPEELLAALVVAFEQDKEKHAERCLALGRTKSVELKDFLAEQTVRTAREWMQARDESNAAATLHRNQRERAALPHAPVVSVPNLPMLALISSWLDHWWLVGVLNEPSYVQALKKGIFPLDGAQEYQRINEC